MPRRAALSTSSEWAKGGSATIRMSSCRLVQHALAVGVGRPPCCGGEGAGLVRVAAAAGDQHRRLRMGGDRRGVAGGDAAGAEDADAQRVHSSSPKVSTVCSVSGSPRSSRSNSAGASPERHLCRDQRQQVQHAPHAAAAPPSATAAASTSDSSRRGRRRRSASRPAAPGCGGTPRRDAGRAPRPGRSRGRRPGPNRPPPGSPRPAPPARPTPRSPHRRRARRSRCLTISATDPAAGSSASAAPSRSAVSRRDATGSTAITWRAGGPRRLRHDLAGHAEAEHHDDIADPDLGIVHAVQRHRADMREDADPRVGALRQHPRHASRARDMVGAVAPGAVDALAGPAARRRRCRPRRSRRPPHSRGCAPDSPSSACRRRGTAGWPRPSAWP